MPEDVVCFGEMLWDLLPSGAQPGGAPMNVAYHAKKMGLLPALISRVGTDAWGQRLLQLLHGWQLSTAMVQQDGQHATGLVHARPAENHEVAYEIVQPVAWDFIEWKQQFADVVQQCKYFVYGSLSARSASSRSTLLRLLPLASNKVCDINLRPPHYSRETVLPLLQNVALLKLNEHELSVVAGWIAAGGAFNEQAARVQQFFEIPHLVVTRGEKGAVLLANGHAYAHKGYPVPVADTVGSGDAFLAALLGRLAAGAPPPDALDFACATGALVATRKGACPAYNTEDIHRLMKNQAE